MKKIEPLIKVYIASPYSIGDKPNNVLFQIKTSNQLMNIGFCPYVPLLLHFQDNLFPRSWYDWMVFDFQWIGVCDCLLRVGGESKGADMEVEYAKHIGIPVFFSIDELINYWKKMKAVLKIEIEFDSWFENNRQPQSKQDWANFLSYYLISEGKVIGIDTGFYQDMIAIDNYTVEVLKID